MSSSSPASKMEAQKAARFSFVITSKMKMYDNITYRQTQSGALVLTPSKVIFKSYDDQKKIKWSWKHIKKIQTNKGQLLIKFVSRVYEGKSVTFGVDQGMEELEQLRHDVKQRLKESRQREKARKNKKLEEKSRELPSLDESSPMADESMMDPIGMVDESGLHELREDEMDDNEREMGDETIKLDDTTMMDSKGHLRFTPEQDVIEEEHEEEHEDEEHNTDSMNNNSGLLDLEDVANIPEQENNNEQENDEPEDKEPQEDSLDPVEEDEPEMEVQDLEDEMPGLDMMDPNQASGPIALEVDDSSHHSTEEQKGNTEEMEQEEEQNSGENEQEEANAEEESSPEQVEEEKAVETINEEEEIPQIDDEANIEEELDTMDPNNASGPVASQEESSNNGTPVQDNEQEENGPEQGENEPEEENLRENKPEEEDTTANKEEDIVDSTEQVEEELDEGSNNNEVADALQWLMSENMEAVEQEHVSTSAVQALQESGVSFSSHNNSAPALGEEEEQFFDALSPSAHKRAAPEQTNEANREEEEKALREEEEKALREEEEKALRDELAALYSAQMEAEMAEKEEKIAQLEQRVQEMEKNDKIAQLEQRIQEMEQKQQEELQAKEEEAAALRRRLEQERMMETKEEEAVPTAVLVEESAEEEGNIEDEALTASLSHSEEEDFTETDAAMEEVVDAFKTMDHDLDEGQAALIFDVINRMNSTQDLEPGRTVSLHDLNLGNQNNNAAPERGPWVPVVDKSMQKSVRALVGYFNDNNVKITLRRSSEMSLRRWNERKSSGEFIEKESVVSRPGRRRNNNLEPNMPAVPEKQSAPTRRKPKRQKSGIFEKKPGSKKKGFMYQHKGIVVHVETS